MNLSLLPSDFRWGVATSAFQIEGSPAADGRGPSIWDDFCRTPDAIEQGEDGSVATDSYRRWPEDLALLRELGVGGYRFSVAWPRVQPDGRGAVNPAGLAYYDRMVDDLLAAGIEPMVTLYHWDLPSALQHDGGWVARTTAQRFADYAAIVAARLGDRVQEWVTINEPLCCAWIGHLEGRMAPGRRDLRDAVFAGHHLLLGHGLAVEAVRAHSPAPARVGIVLNLSPCEPAGQGDADAAAARRADGHTNRWWLDPLYGRGYPADMLDVYRVAPPVQGHDLATIATPTDHLGVNYYFRAVVAADPSVATLGYRPVPVPGSPVTAMGWEVHPQGLYDVLMRLTKDYEVPRLYVTESGAAFEDVPDASGYVADTERADYVEAHVQATADAIGAGAPVAGFYAWSLLDNFEWSYGYRPRFGLAYVDYATQRRTLKLSGQRYRSLATAARTDQAR